MNIGCRYARFLPYLFIVEREKSSIDAHSSLQESFHIPRGIMRQALAGLSIQEPGFSK